MMPVQVVPRPAGPPARPPAGTWRTRLAAALERRRQALRADPCWRPVLLSWLAARVVVLLALAVASGWHAAHPDSRLETLLGWDAAWYRRIADTGYGSLSEQSLRFFPLLPALARALSPLLLGNERVALLLVANGSALATGVLLHRLCRREGLDRAVADRAVWAAAFAPAAFVQVMGYTEPLYTALVCALLLCLRDRRWAAAAGLGLALGALRPPGVVLGLVVLVEAVRGLRTAGAAERLQRLAAVLAPAAGLGLWLLYVRARFGSALLPFRAQVDPTLRGAAFVDPVPGVVDALRGVRHLEVAGSGLHVLWAALSLALLVVVARRLPLSWTVLAAATLVLAGTARSMTSFERYAGSTVPLLVAVALLTSCRSRGHLLPRASLGVAALLLGVYATAAFLHLYVP